MKNVKLSIIVPVYNTEKYLMDCIGSLFNQKNLKIEVIAVDDGSTDNSLSILYALQSKFDKLIVLKQKNKGVSAARNYGKSIASGDYITFVDADDTIDNNAYTYIIDNMIKSDIDISIYAFRRCYASKRDDDLLPWADLSILNEDQIKNDLIPLMFSAENEKRVISGSVCRSVFKTTLIKKLTFNESISMQEDLLFCIYAYFQANKLQIVNKVKYNYIKHSVTTTECYRENYYKESLQFEETQVKALRDIGLYDAMISKYQNKRMDMYSLCISNLYRFDAPKNINTGLYEIVNGFTVDKYFQHLQLKSLSKRNRILFILLKFKCKRLISAIYCVKEKKRRNVLQK